ncbi:MAG: nucleotide exchange factor GrpE [Nitrospirota bacterium]
MGDPVGQEENFDLREDEGGVFHIESDNDPAEKEASKEELLALKDAVEQKDQEIKKRDERYRYLLADFENYKKRAQKDQVEQFKFANEKLLKEAVVVLDDLERAMLHANKTDDFEKIMEGLVLVSKQFLSFLGRFGVVPIESLSKAFDPACHQAVGQVVRGDLPDGEVTEEIQRGYMLYDRLIRPSFVLISKKGDETTGDS